MVRSECAAEPVFDLLYRSTFVKGDHTIYRVHFSWPSPGSYFLNTHLDGDIPLSFRNALYYLSFITQVADLYITKAISKILLLKRNREIAINIGRSSGSGIFAVRIDQYNSCSQKPFIFFVKYSAAYLYVVIVT